MKKILHVITTEADELSNAMVAADQKAGAQVEVVKLSAEVVDYQQLLEAIFRADSVQSW